jgi:hypothetical protein
VPLILLGLVDIAVEELEGSTPSAPPPFNSRFASVARISSMSGQCPATCSSSSFVAAHGRRKRRHRRPYAMAILKLGAAQRSMARVSAAEHGIIEGSLLVIGRRQSAVIPVVGLYRDLVAERLDQFNLDLPAKSGNSIAARSPRSPSPDGLLLGIDASETVEIRRALFR